MIAERIKKAIRDIPDFPKPGILFKDITSIMLDPVLCSDIADEFVKKMKGEKVDAILAIESRGFFFGPIIAQKMKIPFIPIRKQGKLPGDTIAFSYDLEYGTSVVEMHRQDLPKGSRVIIHDDLLATGGTASAAAELAKIQESQVIAFTFIVKLNFLNGEKRLGPYTNNILSLVDY